MFKEVKFVGCFTEEKKMPSEGLPEFAFIGRSNVGKSSLINALLHPHQLAKTSSKPGKTQTINPYLVEKRFHLVDLPGYGYAEVPLKVRAQFERMIKNYLLNRRGLVMLFILIDIRHEPLANDLAFINWAGGEGIPLNLVFTKADKLSYSQIEKSINLYKQSLLEYWEDLPELWITSSTKGIGINELRDYLQKILEELGR